MSMFKFVDMLDTKYVYRDLGSYLEILNGCTQLTGATTWRRKTPDTTKTNSAIINCHQKTCELTWPCHEALV